MREYFEGSITRQMNFARMRTAQSFICICGGVPVHVNIYLPVLSTGGDMDPVMETWRQNQAERSGTRRSLPKKTLDFWARRPQLSFDG